MTNGTIYEETTFLGIACDEPSKTCFCTSVGYGPYNEEGLDLLLVKDSKDGNYFFARILTKKGDDLAKAAGWLTDANADVDAAADVDFESRKRDAEKKFSYRAGQFAELSVNGKGEIPIGIASSPTAKGFVKFTVNKTGMVTDYLHKMNVGGIMGIRGPLGNSYPWETLEGKNVVIIRGDLHSPPCDPSSYTCWKIGKNLVKSMSYTGHALRGCYYTNTS